MTKTHSYRVCFRQRLFCAEHLDHDFGQIIASVLKKFAARFIGTG